MREMVDYDHCYVQSNFTEMCLPPKKQVGTPFPSTTGEVKLSRDASVNTVYLIHPACDRQSIMVTITFKQAYKPIIKTLALYSEQKTRG